MQNIEKERCRLHMSLTCTKTVPLVFLTLVMGCATPGPVKGSRSIASVSAKLGLTCLAAAPVFSVDQPIDERPLEDWLEQKVADGLLDRASLELFSTLPTEQRMEPLSLALAEAYTYGQVLTADYDRLLEKGFTLQRIMHHSATYARLQALFFLKHELIDLAFREFEKNLVDNLEIVSSENAQDLVQRRKDAFLNSIREVIARRAPDSRYSTLALAEIESDLSNVVESVGTACSPNAERKMKSISFGQDVIKAAQTLPKRPGVFRLFQTTGGAPGIHVESIVKKRAKEIRATWAEEKDRSPQSVSGGKVIYPDENPAYKGPGNIYGNTFPKGVWALTFDDGPKAAAKQGPLTAGVLANLKKHGVKATFFILAQQISRKDCQGIETRIKKDRPKTVFPDLARQEQAEGHAVESHSYYHSQSSKATPAELRCEVVTANETIKEVIGIKPKYFRLPYGQGVSVRSVRKVIADAGMVHVHWTVDTLDWNDKDPESIYRRTIKQMKSGGIILFHDVHWQSVIASEKVMAYLKDPKNGLRTVTIPEIVDELNAAATAK